MRPIDVGKHLYGGERLGLIIILVGEVLLVDVRIFEMRPKLEQILVRIVIRAKLKDIEFSKEYK